MIGRRKLFESFVCFAGLAAVAPWASAVVPSPGGSPATVYFGLDNATLSSGGPRPNADAAAAAFASAAGATAVQDFESFATGAVPASIPIGGTTAAFTNLASAYAQISRNTGTFDTYPTSGSNYLEALSANGTSYFAFSFDRGVRALGFYITDASDWIGSGVGIASLQIVLHRASGDAALDLLGGLDAASVVNGNAAFFGVIDDAAPILGFSIFNPAGVPGEDAIGIDDLRVSAVPEPSMVYLAGAGLLALRRTRRRAGQ